MTSVFRAGGHKKIESLRINLSDLSSQQGCVRDPGHFQSWNPGTRPGTTPGIPSKCDVEVIDAPSRLRVIHTASTLAKIKLTRDLGIEEKTTR